MLTARDLDTALSRFLEVDEPPLGNVRAHLCRMLVIRTAMVVTLLAAFATPLATRAADKPVRGGVLHVAANAEPTTLDCMITTATACTDFTLNFFEQLYTVDKNYRVVPMLADGFPSVSANGKTVKIRLRTGVLFHDGSTMVAQDAIASIERWGKLTAAGKLAFTAIKDVRADDPRTVRFELGKPFAPLLADIASGLFILPAKVANDAGTKPLTDAQLIGTGPYRFDSWQHGQGLKLKRFDRYAARAETVGGLGGKKVAYIDEIDIDIVKDSQVRLSGLLAGQYAFAEELSEDALPQIKALASITPEIGEPGAWFAIVPNKAAGPFTNVKLRQAVALAIDRASIARGIGPDTFWYLDGSVFFPVQRGLYSAAGTQSYNVRDVERAKRLLKEAGYSGQPLLYMTTKDNHWMYDVSQVVVPQLEAIGFKIDLEVYDWPTILTKRSAKTGWDMFVTGFPLVLDPTAAIWTNPQWPGSYDSARMRELLARWGSATLPTAKSDLIRSIQETFYSELPVVKVANIKGLDAHTVALKGYAPFARSFWNTWLAP